MSCGVIRFINESVMAVEVGRLGCAKNTPDETRSHIGSWRTLDLPLAITLTAWDRFVSTAGRVAPMMLVWIDAGALASDTAFTHVGDGVLVRLPVSGARLAHHGHRSAAIRLARRWRVRTFGWASVTQCHPTSAGAADLPRRSDLPRRREGGLGQRRTKSVGRSGDTRLPCASVLL